MAAPTCLTEPPTAVTRGSVTSTLIEELQQLCRELAERRQLADDLAAWFEQNPKLSEKFGAFQRRRR